MKNLAAAMVALLALPLAAEAQSKPDPERQQANAAKLAGLVRFVGESCPDAKPDYERFKAVVAAMGVDLDTISKGEPLIRSMSYTEAYRKDVAESCRKAVELFGEKGTSIPGLILRKAS